MWPTVGGMQTATKGPFPTKATPLYTLDAIAGMLEEGGFYAASKYLRQRREL